MQAASAQLGCRLRLLLSLRALLRPAARQGAPLQASRCAGRREVRTRSPYNDGTNVRTAKLQLKTFVASVPATTEVHARIVSTPCTYDKAMTSWIGILELDLCAAPLR